MFPYTSRSGRRRAGLPFVTRNPTWPRASARTSRTRGVARRRTVSGSGCAREPVERSSQRAGGRVAAALPSAAEAAVRTAAVQGVFREGRPSHGRRVVLFVAPGDGEVAFVVGKRIGGAVDRNRARRILREALRMVMPEGIEGHDVVLVAREDIRGARTQDLEAELGELLERGGANA